MKEVRHYAGGSLSHDDVTIMIAENTWTLHVLTIVTF
jgi:hypothetical protein